MHTSHTWCTHMHTYMHALHRSMRPHVAHMHAPLARIAYMRRRTLATCMDTLHTCTQYTYDFDHRIYNITCIALHTTHACMHPCMHTYIHALRACITFMHYMHTCLHYINTYIYTYMHTDRLTCITYIHTYIHYIHTCIHDMHTLHTYITLHT